MSSDSEEKPKSTLSDLRNFRLQKINGPSAESPNVKRMPGRRRLQAIECSDSDEEDSLPDTEAKKPKIELSVKDKEQRFISAARIEPGFDPMDVQDALLRCNWDVSQSLKYLKQHFTKKQSSQNRRNDRDQSNGHSSSKKTYSKRDNSDDSDDMRKPNDIVYDSDDDSDVEVQNKMSKYQEKVFEFLNTAPMHELLTVKSCSEKKANALVEQRPFVSWKDLVFKLKTYKSLTTDLLNNAHDLIVKRNNLSNVMAKCSSIMKKLESAIETGGGIIEQPTLLNSEFKLAEYQLIGLNWLAVMHKESMNGILADEMGLGKTIQVIAFLAYLKENNLSKATHLIVVPSSTLDNWQAELSKWCPSLLIEKYYGNQDERRSMRIRYAKRGFQGIDVLLTTYHMVGSTAEERKMFRVSKLHYVIFDEAHMLKNMTTQRYLQLINVNAQRRILLTGTPLQNNLLELMSLLCFVMPSFFARNRDDITSLFQKKNQKTEDTSTFEQSQIEQAKRIMKPFVLRRLKKDVLKYLPTKTEYIKKIPMTPEQKEYYQHLCDYYSNDGIIKGSNELAGVSIMMDMRKLANHPLLMRYYYSDDDVRKIAEKLALNRNYKKDNAQYIFEDLAYRSDFQIMQQIEKYGLPNLSIPDELVVNSGKFKELDILLPKLKEGGHRTLIFSQFTMMLDVIERYLDIRKYGYVRLDGQTVVTERQELINDFNEDPDIFIFLLSTKAGGMGINLTAADTAIIHDIDFNPYNDKQAEDRCHRMGQTKPVSIYRFISEGTIEEGMRMVAEEKLNLEREIHEENGDVQDHKGMVRLLTMALGMDEQRAEVLLTSPAKSKQSSPQTNVLPDNDENKSTAVSEADF